MTLDFSTNGQVTVTMIDYIKMMCMDLPKEMIGSAATPAANHLFRIDNKNATPLDKERSEQFFAPDDATALPESKGTTRYPYCCVFPVRADPIPERS
jgi:hypothetical protein